MVAKLKVDQLETVDGTGIITANNQLTAPSFAGDGSNLTGIKGVTVATTAPGTPSTGDLWFNSDTSEVSGVPSQALVVYNGTDWALLTAKGEGEGEIGRAHV